MLINKDERLWLKDVNLDMKLLPRLLTYWKIVISKILYGLNCALLCSFYVLCCIVSLLFLVIFRSDLIDRFQAAHHNTDGSGMKELDQCVKKKTDHFQDEINKACIPRGLYQRFPGKLH